MEWGWRVCRALSAQDLVPMGGGRGGCERGLGVRIDGPEPREVRQTGVTPGWVRLEESDLQEPHSG